MKLLFVTNGNGEISIADRIAEDVRRLRPDAMIDHFPLVGDSRTAFMNEVGPRRPMPSGGLIAMGNVGNIVRDLRGGLLSLTLKQRSFLVAARGHYDVVAAVGDVFALIMALATRAPVIYVGTAKSVLVAPYGPMERRMLRRARRVFVRDAATAADLRERGVDASAPGNVIVDLFAGQHDDRAQEAVASFAPAVALFPGSRASAYDDAAFLLELFVECARALPNAGAVLSIAPMLDASAFAQRARTAGLQVEERDDARIPFIVKLANRTIVRAWRGAIGAILPSVTLVMGQAGTANEAAAAAGVPVVAFERGRDRKTAWYRMRQHGLLGDALCVLPGSVSQAAPQITSLLHDAQRRERMGDIGRARMGAAGGAAAIARAIVEATA